MTDKYGASFNISEEAFKRVTADQYVTVARDAWLRAWQAGQQLTEEQRAARLAERKRQQIADWRAARADHERVTPTLKLLCEALGLSAAEAEHYVQPYCSCDQPLDSETGMHCDFYDLDINPPQED